VVVARVKAVLRGGRWRQAPAAPVAGIAFNGWTLDTTRCELIIRSVTDPLTQGEYGLLLALTQNAPGAEP
jgi:DNA-binding response OmpR family regulator